ncbi:nuclear transport factor 2 family protein [Chelativorans xinjiangense]|uniref:nuclear transport factor 2 family protein n=1 Tax=Chelativorans xinjiangense TaxID=2681485 RepID=UPI00135CABD9|nr:nuclear transport factor 2 family protein [Chelativorans xinjiangense]
MTLDPEDVQQWLSGYKHSWEKQDADAFVSLYTDNAVYIDRPFSKPVEARDFHRFWSDLATRQAENRIDFELLGICADRAFANFEATYLRVKTDERRAGNGIFILDFDDAMRCTKLREWQHWYSLGSEPDA